MEINTARLYKEPKVLDLESEAMRGLGSIPTGGNILLLDFFCFHAVKTKMPIFAFSYSLWKTRTWNTSQIQGARLINNAYSNALNALNTCIISSALGPLGGWHILFIALNIYDMVRQTSRPRLTLDNLFSTLQGWTVSIMYHNTYGER